MIEHRRRLGFRVAGVVALVLPVASLAATVNDPTAMLGACGLWLSLVLIVYLVLHRLYVRPHPGRSRALAVALALVAAAALPTSADAVLASTIRNGPGYAKRYGP